MNKMFIAFAAIIMLTLAGCSTDETSDIPESSVDAPMSAVTIEAAVTSTAATSTTVRTTLATTAESTETTTESTSTTSTTTVTTTAEPIPMETDEAVMTVAAEELPVIEEATEGSTELPDFKGVELPFVPVN